MTVYTPALDGTPEENSAELRRLLTGSPGRVRLPAGRRLLAGGLVLDDGWTLTGAGDADRPRTVLAQTSATERPFVHVLGSHAGVENLAIDLPAANPGSHDGDRCTAVTVGSYLYADRPDWLEQVTLRGLRVARRGRCTANSIAIMGAVRELDLQHVDIGGGGTGVAVHWGAVGPDVTELTGPSYHPHHLRLRDIQVTGAYEGFYLSSVHDVSVTRVRMNDVEIGFRLLPGDNTDRLHPATGTSPISARIEVRGCEIGWTGDQYAIRVAGWGRSEIDHRVTRLDYDELTLDDIHVHPRRTGCVERPRAAVVVEDAGHVVFDRLRVDHTQGVVPARVDGRDVSLTALVDSPL